MTMQDAGSLAGLDVGLDRDIFLRTLIRELSGVMQDVIGLDEASGFISVVGRRMGEQMDDGYRSVLAVDRLTRDQVAEVLVDLKARIGGEFSVVELNEDRIVLTNSRCPFAEKVEGRPAMCMMTSNVFGTIAADNLGYAKVELSETIATGSGRCGVTVHLRPTDAALAADGREYFADA